jgi:peptide/nickel transport system substrate-binding protein
MIIRALLFSLLVTTAAAAPGKTFRWASQGDAASLDPHAQNENVTNQISLLSYESLLQYDKQMKLMPMLSTSWENPEPNRWIFHLRKGVRFHDGTPFTADDVVFSFERAKFTTASFRIFTTDSGTPRRIDDLTVEFVTANPNPIELNTVATIAIMSRKWCEKHGVLKPQDIRDREETFSARNENGTGPFILVTREPGVRTTYKRNPDWWGTKEGLFEGNVDEVDYRQVTSAPTRVAAIKSGELDFVLDPPVQDIPRLREDPTLKVWEGPETRVIFLGFDQARDELLYADVKGRNPFKDVRVRKALYQAIDVEAIRTQVMRGLSIPTGVAVPSPTSAGLPPSFDQRMPYDPAAAKKLLAEAGYPNGFGFTLTCPNNRYINDEKICTAIAAMWAKVGLDVKVDALARALFFPKALKLDVSAYIWGWGSDSGDAMDTLKPVLHSRDEVSGAGNNNAGNYKVAELDALIDAAAIEMNLAKRQEMINKAFAIVRDQVLVIPLHRQVIPWLSRAGITVVHRPNNQVYVPWVRVP